MTDYESARAKLRSAEAELMLARENVAQMRRELPPGPMAADYTFDSPEGLVQLADLSTDPARPLVVYHFMYGGPKQASPCPMCSLWADGWNAVRHHLEESMDFALVTQGSVADNKQLSADHGWDNLRWLSAADNSFKTDFGSQDSEGNQWPFFTVFERDGDDLRLSYSGGAHIDDDYWRGVDLLSPVWHFLDLTRGGRGDWMPSLHPHT